MRVALITKQIGHYHHARFRSAAACIEDLGIISVTNQGEFEEFISREAKSYPVTSLFSNRKAYETCVAGRSLGAVMDRELEKLQPDIVVISGWASAESFATIAWARRMRRRIVIMSESQAFDAPRSKVRELVKARIVGLCDAALVGGPTQRDYVVNLGIPRDCTHLGYNAVDNDYYARSADRARREESVARSALKLPDRYILASARFIAKKNLPVLIAAYSKALGRVPSGPSLVILGDGFARAEIESAITDNGVRERVRLCGFQPYEKLPAFYGLAEAFVHVPVVEQWGLVVNEAMASGLPLVVSKTCGVASAVVRDGMHGFIVDPCNLEDIALGLVRMFEIGPAARSVMGHASREAIADWGPERFGTGLNAAILSALGRKRRSSFYEWDRLLLRHLAGRTIRDVA